ncbi:MAG TPA: NUDIX hydrolase [Streptosporangiaceae bacterium]|jgi:8-oxo-dGTP pyrophosphatase MutT (NUDIX family)|nr:NUDIX hydrolase [Streptosporangiaceae bacterium]
MKHQRSVESAPWLTDATADWPVVGSEKLAEGSVVTVRRDQVRMPDGAEVGREVIEHPGAVGIVALDDAGQVLLIRQYRHPVGRMLWEIPAGLRDVAGEPPLVTARRELLEEAGYLAADWQVLADFFTSPGITSERLRVYLARGMTRVPDAERDYVPDHEEAHLTVEWAPLDVVVSRILAGNLHNGVMMIGVLAAMAAKQDGFATLRAADAAEL